jgi:hypothetical protein
LEKVYTFGDVVIEHNKNEREYKKRERKHHIPSWMKRCGGNVDVAIQEVTEELDEMREEHARLERKMTTGRALLQDLKEYKNDLKKA